MPMWKRFAFATPVALALFWIALSVQAWAWTNASVMQIESELDSDIEFDDTFFDLNGGFGATDVRITKFAPNGEELVNFKIDRVTVQTPGLGWMFYNTLIDTSEELPDRIGIVLDNPRNIADDDSTPGNYTNLPFDAMGCVESALTPGDLRVMGVPSERQITLLLERDSDSESTGTFRVRTEGAGEMEMRVKVGMQRPVHLEHWADTMQTMALHSAQLTFTDLGHIAKRNAYCAKKHNLSAKAFTDYHMQEVARFAAASGTAYGAGTLAQYRDFAENGGTLVLRTAGTRKLTLMQFATMERTQKMQAYQVMIAANGKAPANFGYAAAAPMATAPSPVASLPASITAPAPMPAQAAAGGLPAPGTVVPVASLVALTGQHIDVSTKFGSVRKGVLTLVGPLAINLLLDKEEGGLLLTMPTDSITEIKYTPPAPPASAQQAKAP
jgi:hypothetical protein